MLKKNLKSAQQGYWFFLFIGEMIIDAELSYDSPVTDHCGTCTNCIDGCPTDAIYEPYRVDAIKCISYLTIELKEEIVKKYQTNIVNWIYGYDICQDICPWNSKSVLAQFNDLHPRDYVADRNLDFWENLTPEQYDATFRGSAIRRANFDKFKSNVDIVSHNIDKIHQKN